MESLPFPEPQPGFVSNNSAAASVAMHPWMPEGLDVRGINGGRLASYTVWLDQDAYVCDCCKVERVHILHDQMLLSMGHACTW